MPNSSPLNLRKPLLLEQKQGYGNKAVLGGLDLFVARKCEETLRGKLPAEAQSFFKDLRKSASQYMTLSKDGRAQWIEKALTGLSQWGNLQVDSPAAVKTASLKLSDEVRSLIPKEKLKAFERTGIKTVDDLFHYSPKWALHQSRFTPIAQCVNGEEAAFIKARINGISQTRRGPRDMTKVVLQDESGYLSWIWFNRPYLKKELSNGRWVILHEAPQVSKWGKQVVGKADTYEFLEPEEEKALVAGKVLVFYPSTPTLTQSFWRKVIQTALEKYKAVLPQSKNPYSPLGQLPLAKAIQGIHNPGTLEEFETARQRLAFEELLTLQSFLMIKRKMIEKREKGRRYNFEGSRILKFRKSIPYTLTQAQKKVVKEIREDLAKPYPVNRLLQGDVGSGKTLVAAISILYAADSGVQSALMAPTEILSQQHFRNLQKLLEPVGLKMVLLTSGMKAKERRETLRQLESGEVDLVIGTHALLEPDVRFKNLGFIVIDERHKFGVLQRAALEDKGKWPDCLMMTATPFPRALVLTEYGDTDLSLLDEFPKGRKAIQTSWKGETKKNEVYEFVKARVLRGEQAFWVFAVVEESKTFLKSAVQMYQHFQKEVFHGFRVGLLHGKMKKEEKEAIMEAFVQKHIQILVTTTVVEVGVDVANATVMVVENAERFGLAQLHQLRGRVGRGPAQSYCVLLTSALVSSNAVERMKIMASTLDGFKLSEFDLKMRGPGEIFGVAQSGRREGGIVDLKRDVRIVDEAREAAKKILDKDPGLKSTDHRGLRENLENKYHDSLDLAQIS